jgi:hypothetical protein
MLGVLSLEAIWNFNKGPGLLWLGHRIMGHKGPVQRPRCIRTVGLKPNHCYILCFSIPTLWWCMGDCTWRSMDYESINYSDVSGQVQALAPLPSDKQRLELVMQQWKKLLSLQEIAISHPGCRIDIILTEVLQCIGHNVFKLWLLL